MKRKNERAPTLNLLIKIKRGKKFCLEPILTDQAVFEYKLFKSRRISDLEKYLKSLRKSKHFPDEMYYNVVQNGQETKKTAVTDSEKCNLFNDFFSDVFTKDGNINYLRKSERRNRKTTAGPPGKHSVRPRQHRKYNSKKRPSFGKVSKTYLPNLP